MIKNTVAIALLGLCLVNGTACKKPATFKTTANGLEYMIAKHDDANKITPKPGDFVEIHIVVHLNTGTKDTILTDSRKNNDGKPFSFPFQKPQGGKVDLMEGFGMMAAGDSAIFRIPVDSFAKQGPLPPFMKKGMKLEYNTVMVSIKSQEQKKADDDAKAVQQKTDDDKKLQDYFTKNSLKPTKTASGLYYSITKEGAGNMAQAGQNVTVRYTGKTLEGIEFDSNVDTAFHHTEPFSVVIGQGRVIRGWDEGLALLKKGSKATLYIPSPLAYGPQSPSPKIAPNSILMFDVEVTDIKDAPKQAPGPQHPGGAPTN